MYMKANLKERVLIRRTWIRHN